MKVLTAEAAALQVAAMALGNYFPQAKDPSKLLAAIQAADKPTAAAPENRMLSPAEAGKLLSLPARQVRDMVRRGALPGKRLSHKVVRVPEKAVRELAAGGQ
jgi:hypothetical protein